MDLATDHTGPHLLAGVFCEKVIEDKEGVLTLVRLVDRITQTATGSDPPEQMPPFLMENLFLVVMLRADQAKGRYALRVRPQDPSGRNLPHFDAPIQLSPGPAGQNVVTAIQLAIELEGVYWFDVLFCASKDAERLLTRVPLEIQYVPQRTV